MANSRRSSCSAQSSFYLLLMLQRRMRLLRQRLAPRTNAELGILLSMLPEQGSITIEELSRVSGLASVKLSRLLKEQERLGLIQIVKSPIDSRNKLITSTELGKRELQELRNLNNSLAILGCQPLNARARTRLATLFSKICDKLEINSDKVMESSRFKGEEPLVHQQRRMVTNFGMAGRVFFDGHYSITTYQILVSFLHSNSSLTFSNLRVVLGIEGPYLSRELNDLEQSNLIYRAENPMDRRSPLFSLTSEGQKTFAQTFAADEKRFNEILESAMSEIERHELKHLLEQIATTSGTEDIAPPLTVELCSSAAQFMQARKFFVEQLVKNGRHSQLDSSLLPESSYVLTVHQPGVICAVVELSKRAAGLELTQIELLSGIPPKRISSAILDFINNTFEGDLFVYLSTTLAHRVKVFEEFMLVGGENSTLIDSFRVLNLGGQSDKISVSGP